MSGLRQLLNEPNIQEYLQAVVAQTVPIRPGSPVTRSEVYQDACLALLKTAEGNGGPARDPAKIRAYLRQAARNALARLERHVLAEKRYSSRKVRFQPRDQPGPHEDSIVKDVTTPSAAYIRKTDARRLEAAIGRLTPRHRRVIRAKYVEGMTFEQIGDLFETNAQSACALLQRALKNLKREFDLPPDSAVARASA